MASFKVMPSSTPNSTNSDLNSHHNLLHHRHHHNQRHQFHRHSQMISGFDDSDDRISAGVDGILRDVYSDAHPTEEISLIDAAGAISAIEETTAAEVVMRSERRTAEEVWREIVEGRCERKECKVEAVDEMMTLEDFLAKEGVEVELEAEVAEEEVVDVKVDVSSDMQQLFEFDHGLVQSSYQSQPQQQPSMAAMGGVMVYGSANGNGGGMKGLDGRGMRGKRRGGPILEPLDKAAQQRQRRMIKNRESAARSRERKQAYQLELESLAMKLEEENEQLLREKAERKNERFKQLMEKVIPVVEKRRPPRVLRRVRSMQW